MDFKSIYEAMQSYEKMSSYEVQSQITPIIKSYDKSYLSEVTGISEHTLCNMIKRIFADMDKKPSFVAYIKLMSLGLNADESKAPKHKQRERILTDAEIEERRQQREAKKAEKLRIREAKKEATKQKNREYAKAYYQNITKAKRKNKEV